MNFIGKAIPLKGDEISFQATKYNIPIENLEAIVTKESNAQFYMADNRLPILFEAHKFSAFTGGIYDKDYPNLSSPSWNPDLYGKGGAHQYARLADAMVLNEKAALEACSWGAFQIMGFNYEKCGYSNVHMMVEAFMYSAAYQVNSFMYFLDQEGLLDAVREWDIEKFAYEYNGPQYQKNQYAMKLDKIRNDLKNNVMRIGSSGIKVEALQKALAIQGFDTKADGQFGAITEEQVKSFQSANGLVVDGVVGAETWSMLAMKRGNTTSVVDSKRVKGAIITGAAGVGITAQAIPNLIEGLNMVKQVADAASGVTTSIAGSSVNEIIKQEQTSAILLSVAGIILIAAAGYFIWTKFHDKKKEGGTL